MSPPVFRAVVFTAILCAIAGYVVVSRMERRRDREALRRDEQWREHLWQQETGAVPPVLTGAERGEFRAIAARLKRQDAGLGILSSDRSEP